MEDPQEAKTTSLKPCRVCETGLFERDKFCRRCGARQGWRTADIKANLAPAPATSPLGESDPYHRVSGPLIKAVTAGVSAHTSLQFYNRFVRSFILALISVPVWLIIILLSPLDAYAAARDVSSQIVCK